jgi:lipoprotein-anchoring transpeptidase ErfK/SrfK
MDDHAPPLAVHRGRAAVLAAACVVLLIAVLGAAGVLEAPDATAQAAPPPASPAERAVAQLVLASGELIAALDQPAQDAATPEPIDTTRVVAQPEAVVDSTALPMDAGMGMRVVYAIHAQRVWLVGSDGAVARTYRVSGRLDRPAPGEYEVYSRSRTTTSFTGDESMEYMVRFAHGQQAAIGFHDIPVDAAGVEVQTKEQLGLPLSAGCVRQALEDAIALWEFAPVGTKVVVVA